MSSLKTSSYERLIFPTVETDCIRQPKGILQSQHNDNPQNNYEEITFLHSELTATFNGICNDPITHVLGVDSVLWLEDQLGS